MNYIGFFKKFDENDFFKKSANRLQLKGTRLATGYTVSSSSHMHTHTDAMRSSPSWGCGQQGRERSF